MTRVEEQGLRYASCPNCFGTWIGSIALVRRLNSESAASPADATSASPSLSDLSDIVASSDTQTTLRCPECEKSMTKDRVHPMIPVQIDRCKPCDSVWLDVGELGLLRALYRELMTSDDPEIHRRREKVASALARWETRTTLTDDVLKDAGNMGSIADIGFQILGDIVIGGLFKHRRYF